jgi:hypothetical protein
VVFWPCGIALVSGRGSNSFDALKERVKEHARRLVSGTSAFSASKAHQRGLANPACLRREPLDPSIARRNAPVLPSAAHDFRDRMRLLSNAASVVDAGVWQPLFCMVDKDRVPTHPSPTITRFAELKPSYRRIQVNKVL